MAEWLKARVCKTLERKFRASSNLARTSVCVDGVIGSTTLSKSVCLGSSPSRRVNNEFERATMHCL